MVRWCVVNCFQIVFLLWSLTTLISSSYNSGSLWIAFKLYFYCGLWQRSSGHYTKASRCELLSNCIFTVVFDNVRYEQSQPIEVVNCFQIVFLLWSLTTAEVLRKLEKQLWIAFKLYFYCGLWQHLSQKGIILPGCELLSNCIFTVVFDNHGQNLQIHFLVVNCFQIVFLLWSLTT